MIFTCTHTKLDLVGRGKNNFPLFSMFGLEVKKGKKKKKNQNSTLFVGANLFQLKQIEVLIKTVVPLLILGFLLKWNILVK